MDTAMMIHPRMEDTAAAKTLACQALDVEFFGKAVHASALPEAGINALEAMIQSFVGINSLRQHIKDKARIHGIIMDGGNAVNIVPAHSSGSFLVRAENDAYLDELKRRVVNCFTGAATASGARLEYKWAEIRYRAMRNNLTMAQLFHQNMQSLGRNIKLCDPYQAYSTTDMGNVSQVVPSIHPFVAIVPPGIAPHTREFESVAGSESGIKRMLDGARALAMTAIDMIADPDTVTRARQEFQSASHQQ